MLLSSCCNTHTHTHSFVSSRCVFAFWACRYLVLNAFCGTYTYPHIYIYICIIYLLSGVVRSTLLSVCVCERERESTSCNILEFFPSSLAGDSGLVWCLGKDGRAVGLHMNQYIQQLLREQSLVSRRRHRTHSATGCRSIVFIHNSFSQTPRISRVLSSVSEHGVVTASNSHD